MNIWFLEEQKNKTTRYTVQLESENEQDSKTCTTYNNTNYDIVFLCLKYSRKITLQDEDGDMLSLSLSQQIS